MTAQGNVTLDSGFSIFDVALNGPNVGTDYDQLNVNGSVNLGRSDFSGSLGFTPLAGDTFMIIRSTAPIVDTFNGLPEGATVTIGGVPFTISYAADGGDAVVLTAAVTPTLAATTTALTSSENASTLGQNVTFTAAVASAASGTPTGSVLFTIDGQAEPLVPLSVVDGVARATVSVSTLTAGRHTVVASYGGDAVDSPSRSSSQIQVVSATGTGTTNSPPVDTDGPRIVSMKRGYGYHMMPTHIVLTFDQALDAVTAEDVKDYRIIGPAGRAIAVKKAAYGPADLTVTLSPVERISIHHPYKLIVDGTAPRGLTNTKGQLLDGANRASADSNYRASADLAQPGARPALAEGLAPDPNGSFFVTPARIISIRFINFPKIC